MTSAGLETMRAVVRLVMRDIVIPGAGVYVTVAHWPPALYLLPILAGMMMVPLVGRAGTPEPDGRVEVET